MCVALEVPNASRRVRLSSSLEGERGQKDAETKHYKQSKRCDHRSEECDRFRHRCLSLPQLHAGALTDPRKATGRDNSLAVVAVSSGATCGSCARERRPFRCGNKGSNPLGDAVESMS